VSDADRSRGTILTQRGRSKQRGYLARFLSRFQPYLRTLGTLHDFLAAGVSFFAAYVFTIGLESAWITPGIIEKLTLFAFGSAVIFYFFSLNGGSWRYASLPDLTAIIKASTIAVLGYVLVQFLYSRGDGLPRTVPIVLWLFMIASLAGPRIVFRIAKESGGFGMLTGISRPKPGATHVLIYGVNDIAEAYIRAVRLRKGSDVFIAGLVDDDEEKRGRILQGRRVLGTSADLQMVKELLQLKGLNITELVVADSSLSAQGLTLLAGYFENGDHSRQYAFRPQASRSTRPLGTKGNLAGQRGSHPPYRGPDNTIDRRRRFNWFRTRASDFRVQSKTLRSLRYLRAFSVLN
jgi:hypothetical protein